MIIGFVTTGIRSFERRIGIVGSGTGNAGELIGNETQFKYFKGLIGCAALVFWGLLLAQRDL
ncbi:hypothetical protein [Sporosarcina sp. D27]|uniref:hypothetical protein n=1 Tax=Sporosarcina sp. D27 TaxID=1382305 RepID=UPI0004726355|nr:hypothetical protein [Sporosarcina sp. D27]